jgi:hypothetical protein
MAGVEGMDCKILIDVELYMHVLVSNLLGD